MNYHDEVMRTAGGTDLPFEQKLALCGLGIAGEAGEVADLIKKFVYHGKPLDIEGVNKLVKEMGDVRWYLEFLADTIRVTMEHVERTNIEKLKVRYPTGFSHEAANAKRTDAP